MAWFWVLGTCSSPSQKTQRKGQTFLMQQGKESLHNSKFMPRTRSPWRQGCDIYIWAVMMVTLKICSSADYQVSYSTYLPRIRPKTWTVQFIRWRKEAKLTEEEAQKQGKYKNCSHNHVVLIVNISYAPITKKISVLSWLLSTSCM